MDELKGKTLLLISQNYASFVKDQVECLAPFYHKIVVLAVTRPIAEVSNFLPINSLKPFRKKVKINTEGLPGNVTVFTTALNYIPTRSAYRKVGDLHLKVVRRLIKKHDFSFDIIHCHFSYSSGYVGAQLKKEFQVPLIITAHGFDVYDLPFRDSFWRKRISGTFGTADRIITVSRKNEACIRKLTVTTPVDILPNGFQKKLFYPMKRAEARAELKLPAGRKIIVTVGNLIEIKGQNFLIEAMASLIAADRELLCYIIGSGGQRKKLEKQIKNLGLQENVFLQGSLRHDAIAPWLNAADIFVLPSLNEGNPTVLFECLACGCPFISADVGGVSEILDGDKLGYLFQAGNVKDMEEVIGRALAGEWDRDEIAETAQNYSWDRIAEGIMESHRKVLGI